MNCVPLLLFSGGIGWLEIILILAVVLLLFGAKKLPEVMGSFGKGVNEFKKGINDINREPDGDEKAPAEMDGKIMADEEIVDKERDKGPDGEGK